MEIIVVVLTFLAAIFSLIANALPIITKILESKRLSSGVNSGNDAQSEHLLCEGEEVPNSADNKFTFQLKENVVRKWTGPLRPVQAYFR